MAKLRLMGDDPDEVRETAEEVVQALRDAGMQVGETDEYRNRHGRGVRIYTEVTPGKGKR
jgi:Asp-tRNA(Asn)/Glu-tRNA(Gln) amidotransferase A subunit family amidase